MAKKQTSKKQTTLKRQTSKKLSKLANRYIEHFDGVDLLRTIGEKSQDSTLIDSLGSIFTSSEEIPKGTFSSGIEAVLYKLKTLKQLILLNIDNTKDKKNFDTDEYISDRKIVTDIIFKIQSSSSADHKDLKSMNSIYKKHKQIKQLFD